jgi:hypothetical protein
MVEVKDVLRLNVHHLLKENQSIVVNMVAETDVLQMIVRQVLKQ